MGELINISGTLKGPKNAIRYSEKAGTFACYLGAPKVGSIGAQTVKTFLPYLIETDFSRHCQSKAREQYLFIRAILANILRDPKVITEINTANIFVFNDVTWRA